MMNFEKPFIVLEMANNHNGDIEHGFEIVKNFSDVCKDIHINSNLRLSFNIEI